MRAATGALRRLLWNSGIEAPRGSRIGSGSHRPDAHLLWAFAVGGSSRQFLRQQARQFALVELPLKEVTHVRHVSVIYRKDGYLSPATRRLIEILKAKAKGIAGENAII